jgi:hypothetical protein
MSVIYLIRHGQASFGTDNYDQLSAVGREQSAILGSYFADLREPIHGIYTGTLERQRETAQLVAAALAPNPPPLTLDAAFDEYESDSILRAFAASLTPAQLAEAGWPGLHNDRRRFQFFLERAARAWVEAQIVAETCCLGAASMAHHRCNRKIIAQRRGKTLVVSTRAASARSSRVLASRITSASELNWAVLCVDPRASTTPTRCRCRCSTACRIWTRGRRQLITYR